MAENVVVKDVSPDNATLLLGAAEELGLDQGVVRTSGNGFVVPREVAERAGLVDSDQPPAEPDEDEKE